MPNHIQNVVKISKIKNVEEVIKKITNEEGEFDFNKIVPTPDYIFQGDLGREEREKYGKNNWYEWNIENWGTKWNAYEKEIVKGKSYIKLYFNTAWSCPLPIYRKMAEMLKTKIEVKFADEDIGSNCGEIIYDPDEDGINECYISRDGDRTFANRVWRM